MTDVASNLLVIDFQLDIRIACDDLQQKLQHAEYFICDTLIYGQFSPDFQMVSKFVSKIHSLSYDTSYVMMS